MLDPFHPQGVFALQSAQLSLRDCARLRRHQIPERVCGVIAADALVIGVHLQNIFGPVRIVLQGRQRFNQPPTPFVNEQTRPDASLDIAEARQNFRPTVYAVRVRTAQRDAVSRILRGDGCAVALP